jgi:RNA polymerase sigma factor (TIGR02999 family)
MLLMTDVTKILSQIEAGEAQAAEMLMPLVYEELRKLAAAKLANEKPGQTLQATALVHEAYLRLVDVAKVQHWDSRGHFFSAAAEAMRRILIDKARRRKRARHGGEFERLDLLDVDVAVIPPDEELLLLDDALTRLAGLRTQAAEIVKLRFFAGLNLEEAAAILGVSSRTARRLWVYARAWLRRETDAALERNS